MPTLAFALFPTSILCAVSLVACGKGGTEAKAEVAAVDRRSGVSVRAHRARRSVLGDGYLYLADWVRDLDLVLAELGCGTTGVGAGCVPLREAYQILSRSVGGLQVVIDESDLSDTEDEVSAMRKKARVYDTLETLSQKLAECSARIAVARVEIHNLRLHPTDVRTLGTLRIGIDTFGRQVHDALRLE